MPTIADIARRAGVSTATVSRYLRGEPVRAEAEIRNAIAELGFQPNPIARSLKLGTTHSIGVVVPDVTNPFFAAVVKGVESVFRERSYNILLANTDESVERENEVLAGLVGRVDGLILAPATEQDETPLALRRAGVPLVFLDREISGSDGFDTVLVDNAGGGRQAAEHLLGLGHERIGVIGGPLDTTPGRGRHEGFSAALAEAGLDLQPECCEIGDFHEQSGYQAALRLLGLGRPPTAIFAANNLMAMGALLALHDFSVHIPQELSFIGFDDLALGALLTPPLTVIDRPTEEQGVLAARLLLKRLEGGPERTPRRIVLETRLLVRDSCAPPPSQASRRRARSFDLPDRRGGEEIRATTTQALE